MSILQVAKDYRDKYSLPVFPVILSYDNVAQKWEKQPAVSAWKPFMSRLPTDEEIESGFGQSRVNAIGLACGSLSGITVLDWDDTGVCPYNSPVTVKTISGGRHVYFRYKEGLKNAVRVEGKPVDIRTEGGFVVLPPSGADGCNYIAEWEGELGDRLKELPEFPKLAPDDRSTNGFSPPLIIKEHLNVQDGARDHKLYKLACSLLQKHSLDDSWLLLLGAAKTYEDFGGTFTEEDVKDKYDNAYSFLNGRGQLYIDRGISSVEYEAKSRSIAMQEVSLDFAPKLLKDLKAEDYHIDWIWHGFIARGHITLLSALWKAGKTTLLAELFRSMQSQTGLAGQNTQNCSVLLLSEERETQWVHRRDEKKLDLSVHLLCNPLKSKLKYAGWVAWIEKAATYCVENSISLVVIDTMTTFSSVTDENDASQVNMALLPLNYFREKNIAVLLIHHFRKSGGDEGTASRGSGALMSYVDIIMEFSRLEPKDSKNTQRKLICLSRFDETPNELILDYTDGEYSSQVITSSHEALRRNKLIKVLNLINKLVLNSSIGEQFTVADLHGNWDDGVFKRPADRTVRTYLDELITMEKIRLSSDRRKVGKTEAKLYRVIDGSETSNSMVISIDEPAEISTIESNGTSDDLEKILGGNIHNELR